MWGKITQLYKLGESKRTLAKMVSPGKFLNMNYGHVVASIGESKRTTIATRLTTVRKGLRLFCQRLRLFCKHLQLFCKRLRLFYKRLQLFAEK